MKKLFTLSLCAVMLFSITACKSKETDKTKPSSPDTVYTEELKSIPNEFYLYDNDLLINIDYYTYFGSVKAPKQAEDALVYKDNTFKRLKAYDTEIKLSKEILFYENDITLPARYYIYNNTIYPYCMEKQDEFLSEVFKFQGIPGNTKEIIIYGGLEKDLIYNIETKKAKVLYDTESKVDYTGYISPDGKYALFNITKNDYYVSESIIFEIKSGKAINVPLPKKDNAVYTMYPLNFVGEKFYFILEQYDTSTIDNNQKIAYVFDIKSGKLSKIDQEGFEKYKKTNNNYTDYNISKTEKDGKYSVYNLKTEKLYSYSFGEISQLQLFNSQSGEMAIGYYWPKGEISGYTASGEPVYQGVKKEDYKYVLVNLKDGKLVEINKYLTADFTKNRFYFNWLSEDTVLISALTSDDKLLSHQIININDIDGLK